MSDAFVTMYKVLERFNDEPFEWGVYDCCVMVCTVILELTGRDVYADFRGRYASEKEAVRCLRKYAGTLEDVMVKLCKENGFPEIKKEFSMRTDIAYMEIDHGPAMGINVGKGYAVAGECGGYEIVPENKAKRVWRING